jgi:hypothetical protein
MIIYATVSDGVSTLGNAFIAVHTGIVDSGKVVVSLFLFVGLLAFFLKKL